MNDIGGDGNKEGLVEWLCVCVCVCARVSVIHTTESELKGISETVLSSLI